jgi:tripartite-type tricarboxylate transporter receptor subunit TctC
MLFFGSPNEVILAPLVNNAVKYKPQDFALVTPSGIAPMVVLTRKDLPVNSVDELIALARKSSAAGKPLSYGTTGLGSMYHLVTENLGKRIGATFNHAPYKGGAPLIQDLAGGQIDFTIIAYQASFEAMVEQGRMKMLASLEKTRPVQLGDFAYNIWGGFFVKKGTPEAVIQRLREVIADARNDPAAVEFRRTARSLEIPAMSGPETAKFFEGEITRMQSLAKGVKLTME